MKPLMRTAGMARRLSMIVALLALGALSTLNGAIAAPATRNAEAAAPASIITVTNTNDSGDGSLRQAILSANLTPAADEIRFNIGGSGVRTINLLSPLPGIDTPMTIDGYSQPGASANTLAWGSGTNATLLIELNGTSAGNASGLVINAPGSVVKGLVVNRFAWSGISVPGSGVTVEGCFIGTNAAGTAVLPNGERGGVYLQGPNNLLGGTTPAARNLISGNHIGVFLLTGSATGNRIEGNLIGTSASGAGDLGNTLQGVFVIASGNTIGGSAAGAGNVISGNDRGGILISEDVNAATNNLVYGNYIGTNAAGTAALGNSVAGVTVDGLGFGASGNFVGGASAGMGNVISGNDGPGVLLQRLPSGSSVQGNYIGTNAAGTAAVPNSTDGVLFQDTHNAVVGGTIAGAGNVISGNNRHGVGFFGGSSGNALQGNLIGTNPAGTGAIGNAQDGVFFELVYPNHNTVGGTAAGSRNVISGNKRNGVTIDGDVVAAVVDNRIQGNYIGTNAAGSAAIPNVGAGVVLTDAAGIVIGGAGAGNVISGNGLEGIRMSGYGASFNSIQGNYIGTNSAGTSAMPNTSHGILVGEFAAVDTIGGTDAGLRNLISGNGGDGIHFAANTGSMTVQGNYIGVDQSGNSAIANAGAGVVVKGGGITIGGSAAGAGNLIARNGGSGVAVLQGADNRIERNSIHSNGALGVDLGGTGVTANDAGDADTGANNLQNYPVLSAANVAPGGTTVQGTLNSTANTAFKVQVFSNAACDPSGHGEGQTYVGAFDLTTDGAGNATFSHTFALELAHGQQLTALAVDGSGNTSEFSSCRAVVNTNPTATSTSVATSTRTATSTLPPTSTATRTRTATATATLPAASTATRTRTATVTATLPPAGTATASRTSTATATASRTATATLPPANTATPTSTATATASRTATATLPPASTATRTRTATVTATLPPAGTATGTRTSTATHTRTATPTAPATLTPPSTASSTSTVAAPPSTAIATASATSTAVGDSTATATPPATWTAVATATSTHTPAGSTPTPTRTPVSSPTSVGGATATPTVISCPDQFADVPAGSPFYSYVRCLVCRGIISGYADGTFRPNNPVTRGQLAKIVANAAGFQEPVSGQLFQDIEPGSAFYPFVQRLAARGIIGGYDCGAPGEPCAPGNRPYFRAGNNATRGQISKIVANAARLDEPVTGQAFRDVGPDHPFYPFIQRLATRQIMSGYSCGGAGDPCGVGSLPYFRPGNNATRGQTSKIVSNSFYPGCDMQ